MVPSFPARAVQFPQAPLHTVFWNSASLCLAVSLSVLPLSLLTYILEARLNVEVAFGALTGLK